MVGVQQDVRVGNRAIGSHSLASQTAPTAAFSYFRINTRREGLRDCLYCFRSTSTDIGGPIRLQNASDVTHLNSRSIGSTSLFEFSSSGYLLKANLIAEVFSSLEQ